MKTFLVLTLIVLIAGCVASTKLPTQDVWTDKCANHKDFRGQFRCNPKVSTNGKMDIITILTFFEKDKPTPGERSCSALALIHVQTVGSQDWFKRDRLEFDAEDTRQIVYGQAGDCEIKFNDLWLVCRKM